MQEERIEFEPWFGEFGWEIMTWVPWCREQSRKYKYSVATSFKGMYPLYKDFISEFRTHDDDNPRSKGRSQTFIKRYGYKGEYYKYGNPKHKYDVLLHARGVRSKSAYNYKRWGILSSLLSKYNCAYIGSKDDQYISDFPDERGLELQALMDMIAGAKCVVGVSSGVMHLSMACDTPVLVWGDKRTYFSQTLEQRYKETWNPFKTHVHFITHKKMQPEPDEVADGVRSILQYKN